MVIPALLKNSNNNNGKVLFIGVGSGEAAAEFATQLSVDPKCCFGDVNGESNEALQLQKGMNTMWNPPAVTKMMKRNDQDSLTALAEAYKAAVDTIGIQQLAPPNIQDTLRQGGTFVFRGTTLLLDHQDGKVGDNCEITDILEALQ